MTYKANTIIFSDLDSTLLADNHYFSKKTKQVVAKLYEQGIYLIPVTARTTNDILIQAKRLGIDQMGGIVAGNNGSQIFDFKTNKWILNEYVPNNVVKDVFNEHFEKYQAKVHFYADEKTYVFNEGKNSLYWAQMMGSDYVVAHDISEIDAPITHLTIVLKKQTTPEESKKIIRETKQKYQDFADIHVYTDRVIEICPKFVNKGYAVEKIKEYLKLDQTVETYAFGDSYNDFPMFNAVDNAIAMENANNDLKDIADDVTQFNNQNDGVANYIITNILK